MPWPLRAETCRIAASGLIFATLSMASARAKSRFGNKSILLKITSAGGTKNVRIFERLIFPVGHREHYRLGAFAKVEQRRADQ